MPDSLMQQQVTDAHGKQVAGITVAFELPAGASGPFSGSPDVVTDARGIATAPALTANTKAGTFTVSAWVAGVNTPATFTVSNSAGFSAPLQPKRSKQARTCCLESAASRNPQ
jgi:adhesin/invasin